MPASDTAARKGFALIMSGPSGTGKSTLAKLLLEDPDLHFSVSCTTRQPRSGEQDGRDYFFLTREAFEERLGAGDFIEHAEVHGNYYGTLGTEVCSYLSRGQDVLLDIDVQGGDQVRALAERDEFWRAHAVQVFVGPPSRWVLEQRLRHRGTETEEVVRRRLGNSIAELRAWDCYDYLVVNDDLEKALAQLRSVLVAERLRVHRLARRAPWDPDVS